MKTAPLSNSERIVIGAMSGTSADGVDACAVAIAGGVARLSARSLGHAAVEFSAPLRRQILSLRHGAAASAEAFSQLGRQITLAYADAIASVLSACRLASSQAAVIAAHGQTLFHAPPVTWQIFDPALLAAITDCTVISDFRRADLAAGGQGAPLVPFADFHLFGSDAKDRVMLNIGGIANITYLPRGCHIDSVRAFDTGPGNCISDYVVRELDPDGIGHDPQGVTALSGVAVEAVVQRVLSNTFFQRPGPRSTDGPRMIELFEAAVAEHGVALSYADRLATAVRLTAESVARAIRSVAPDFSGEIVCSGGGVHNQAIMRGLELSMGSRASICTTDQLGWPSAAKEAAAFALLGLATLDGLPGNLPAVTGASRAVVLGSITPRPASFQTEPPRG